MEIGGDRIFGVKSVATWALLTALALGASLPLRASDEPLLYRADPFGSEATFNPLTHYLNLAFDTTQNPFWFSQSAYVANHGVLWDRIKDPGGAIERQGGFGKFLSEEVYGLRAVPNYTLHLFGGGYDYRLLAEWYEAHGVPYAYPLAFLNSYLANIGNEAVETTAVAVPPNDHIADLFFFDIVGKLLFLNDAVVRFVHGPLGMRAWHFQPMLNVRHLRIDNAGSNYIFRPSVFGETFRPFFHMGLALLAGVSWRSSADDSVTIAGGVAPTDPLEFQGDPMAALFWDRADSLLASMTVNGSSNLAVRLNLYPDVISIASLKTGLFLSYSKANETTLGISLYLPAGVSASF